MSEAAGVHPYAMVVEVRLRPGIADPEGATIERALPALGFSGISGVAAGKSFRFTVEAATEAEATARAAELAVRLLANPVIEDTSVALAVAPATTQPAAGRTPSGR